MSDRHGEPVEVLRHQTDPAHFIWHGRLYVVRDVVAHWAEVDQWWRAALTRVLDCPRASRGPEPGGRHGWARSAGPAPATTVELAPTAGSDWVVTDQTEIRILPHMRSPAARDELGSANQPLVGRLGYAAAAPRVRRRPDIGGLSGDLGIQYEFWRVNAGLGRSGMPRVFDLCHDLGTGQWTLNRGDADTVASGAGTANQLS